MNSKTSIIIIDSNFILLPFQFKIDYLFEIRQVIEGELKFIIFKQIINELDSKLRREPKATKYKRFLDSGFLYLKRNLEKYQIEIIENVKNKYEFTDDFLLKKAITFKKQGNIVYLATNDKELRKKARNQCINTIFLRQKKYVSIERT